MGFDKKSSRIGIIAGLLIPLGLHLMIGSDFSSDASVTLSAFMIVSLVIFGCMFAPATGRVSARNSASFMSSASFTALASSIGPFRHFVEAHAVEGAAHPRLISVIAWFAFMALCATLIITLGEFLKFYWRDRANLENASPKGGDVILTSRSAPSPQNL